jgi:hypothetical protein
VEREVQLEKKFLAGDLPSIKTSYRRANADIALLPFWSVRPVDFARSVFGCASKVWLLKKAGHSLK